MIERVYLIAIMVLFVLAFAVKNVKTSFSTGQSIREKSVKVIVSMVLSAMMYGLILFRIFFSHAHWLLESSLPIDKGLHYVGIAITAVGFLLGVSALFAMGDSWRVGIHREQKTGLVCRGIFRFSRNPYFLSYGILFFGYLLIFPSPVFLILWILLEIVFHRMILEEEAYLEKVHGKTYLEYKEKVNRYVTLRRSTDHRFNR